MGSALSARNQERNNAWTNLAELMTRPPKIAWHSALPWYDQRQNLPWPVSQTGGRG